MAIQDVRINLGAVTDFPVLTNLHSLAGGNIWQSGTVDDAEPHHDQVTISFSLICNGAVAAEDKLNFYWVNQDEAALNEVVDAGLGVAESAIAAALTISDIHDVCDLVFSVRVDRINQTVEGSFIIFSPGPSWQLLIELESAAGALAGANNIVRYRLGTPQIQP